jgi:SAM-dependent methyltransferase
VDDERAGMDTTAGPDATRIDREADFWDDHVFPLDECVRLIEAGPTPNTAAMLDAVEPVAGRRVLDFACGSGLTTAWLAQRGAQVVGVDASPASLARAREVADAVGVEVELRELPAPVGDLGAFDAMVGRFALHHVDLAEYAPWLARHLRPGTPGAFLETFATNPLLAVSRRVLPGRFGIVKMGSDDEAPLTRGDIEVLSRHFRGVRRSVGELTFLRLVDRRALHGRAPLFGRVLQAGDSALQHLPGSTSLSYHQIVHVQGPPA